MKKFLTLALITLALALAPLSPFAEAAGEFCREGQIVWIVYYGAYCMEIDVNLQECIVCGPDVITVYG